MHQRRIPEWLRHAPTPGVRGFASLAGIEAVVRGILVSVYPLEMYRVLQDASVVSEAYFAIGLLSLMTGLMVPWMVRFLPRRWVYMAGVSMFVAGGLLATQGSAPAVVGALVLNTLATVTCFVCFNAYVLDYIARVELGRCETSRMFYSAIGWTAGPLLGVSLLHWWQPAPFLISAGAAALLLALFLYMRLGNGRLITRAHRPPPNPLAYLPRFLAQPRLVAGWLFAVIRSCAWWVYVVYLPIYAIEAGLGDKVGGITLSLANGMLFVTPLMLRWMERNSIRAAVRLGFLAAGLLFAAASLLTLWPALTVLSLLGGAVFLILLDVSAGLPFLMAVKPSERTEMSAVYSSFRDVSGVVTPGMAWLVLLAVPLSGIFAAAGLAMCGAWVVAGRLHPRLGQNRVRLTT